MPRTKNPDKYPESYGKLLLTAFARKEDGIRVQCENRAHANRLRRSLYAYIAAVSDREDKVKMPHDMRDAPRMHQVMITIEHRPGEGPSLMLRNKAFQPENLAVARALESVDDTEAMTELDIEKRSLAERIIDAYESGDIALAERLEAEASGQPLPPNPYEDEEPGDKPPEPEPEDDFTRFLTNPNKE